MPRWNAAGVNRIRMISIAEIGIVIPIATSMAWHRDFGAPTRWSPLSRRNEPIAMAGPVAAMMTGLGNVRQRIDSSKPPASIASAACRVAGLEDRQVESAAEHPLVAREHDGLGVVLLGAVERLVDRGLHRRPEHIDLAVVERDRRDGLVELVVHRAGHRASLDVRRRALSFQIDVTKRCYESQTPGRRGASAAAEAAPMPAVDHPGLGVVVVIRRLVVVRSRRIVVLGWQALEPLLLAPLRLALVLVARLL